MLNYEELFQNTTFEVVTSLWSQQIQSKLDGILSVWGARRPLLTSWVPHFLCIAQKLHWDPIRGKSDQQPKPLLLLLDILLPRQGLSLLKARFLQQLTQPCSSPPQGSPAVGSLWRRLTLWGTPPPLQGALLTFPSLAVMFKLFSPQSPSFSRFLSPLKSHVQCGCGVSLRHQQPLFLFFMSRISPGIWLLSFVTLILHKAHSLSPPAVKV